MPTATAHLQVLQRFQAALAPLGAALHVERLAPFAADECPAANLVLDGMRFAPLGAESGGYDTLQAQADVIVRVHSRGSPHTEQADPTVQAVHQALMADPSLGGVCLRLAIKTSRSTAAAADSTVSTTELGYQATVLVDERTLALLNP